MSHDNEVGVKRGQIIAEKYRLVDMLGRGGMGTVWRADHLSLLSPVAVKVIKPTIAKNPTSLARFLREAKAAALIRSPHVVQILDHGSDGDVAYICMELLEGESLLSRIKRDKRLSAPVTATVVTHVGRAIGKAHDAGIIHRDLKPDNIFLVPNEDEIIAKVLDFGIAKSNVFNLNGAESSPQTQTGALLGTPYYMSPEQATGSKDVDSRSDLWALAVIAFECIIGKRPFQSDSLGDLVLQICSRPKPVPSEHGIVPAGFDGWFDRATQRDPELRFQSAKELSGALRKVVRAVPTVARPASQLVPSTVLRPLGSMGSPAGQNADAADEDDTVTWDSDEHSSELGASSQDLAPIPASSGMPTGEPIGDEQTDGAASAAAATSLGTFSHSGTATGPPTGGRTDPTPPGDAPAIASPPVQVTMARESRAATAPSPQAFNPQAAGVAAVADPSSVGLSSLETLEPLAKTTPPRGRSLMLGAVAGGVLVGVVAITVGLALRDDGSSAPAASTTATDTDTNPRRAVEPTEPLSPTATAENTPEVVASSAVNTGDGDPDSSATDPSATASAAPSPPTPRPASRPPVSHAPPRRPAPPRPAPAPRPPPPDDDVLGI